MAVSRKTVSKLKSILRRIMRDESQEGKIITLATAKQFISWARYEGLRTKPQYKGTFTFVWPIDETPERYGDVWEWVVVANKEESSVGPVWGY